jgi:hypothetical protein
MTGTFPAMRTVSVAALLLIACISDSPPSGSQQAVADVKQLMTAILEPAAETYWDAVGTVIDTTGTHETVPASAEEWAEVWRAALVVAESGNLLMVPGRARDGNQWMRLSRAMVDAGSQAARAAAARDPALVFEMGSQIYEACTACHSAYARETLRPSHAPEAKP